MTLKLHLIYRIVYIALICLLATTAYALYQADQKSRRSLLISTESIERQLEFQLLRIDSGLELKKRFPDLDIWSETEHEPGRCVRFVSTDGEVNRAACRGDKLSTRTWPLWFDSLYRWLFDPGQAEMRQAISRGRVHGTITVSNSVFMEIARAWNDVKGLMSLTIVTVSAVCLLVFMTVNRAFHPAQVIVAGLEQMEHGTLSFRLPAFDVFEWQCTGNAINRLAANQEKMLAEREALALKLMNVQEEERRFLARELHDEFGQCLTALNAVALSISQTAESECPNLVSEGRNVKRITRHMMETLRGMLLRLRLSDIDELGLTQGLKNLVAGWNASRGSDTRYELVIHGDFDQLPDPVPANVYRIVQECLTNASKHSFATQVTITLDRSEIPAKKDGAKHIRLSIEDNGIAEDLSFKNTTGTGLLGVRERVTALGGTLMLEQGKPSGLAVNVNIPLPSNPDSSL